MLRVSELSIRGDEVVMVRGPANVRLVAGHAHILGSALSAARPLIVRRGKILPVESQESPATLQIRLGAGGECQTLRDGVGTRMWQDAVATILRGGYRRIVVAGETDAGKSTFTTFLANRAWAGGRRIAVVDGDMGQADLAPPGVIGATAIVESIIDLRNVTGQAFEVVGTTSPRGVEWFVAEGLRRACEWARGTLGEMLVVNTDGYVRDDGVAYKRDLISALGADAVVILGGDSSSGLGAEVRATLDAPALFCLPRPREAAKTRVEREQRRMSQYLRFLRQAQRQRIAWTALPWVLFGIDFPRAVAQAVVNLPSTRTGRADDARLELSHEPEPWLAVEESVPRRFRLSYGAFRSMFVGLGRGNTVTGFGVLLPRGLRQAELWSPVRDYDTMWLTAIRVWPGERREELTPIFKLGRG